MSHEGSVVSVDIGGGTTKLALIDRRGTLSNWQSFPTLEQKPGDFLEKVLSAIGQLQIEAEHPILGVSGAVAGFVTPEGVLEYNPNLPWLEKTPIATLLREKLHLPVHVDADSNAACIAEYIFGQGKGASRFLCLTGGTGLGVGMMTEGRLLRIAHGCLGDAGHVIVSPTGPVCTCGGLGCAEALLSTVSLGQQYAQAGGGEGATFRTLVQDGRIGKPAALELFREAGYWMGIVSASLASIFLPDRIAIAGGLSQAGDVFFVAAKDSFRAHGGRLPLSQASLVRASTGEHATLLGAAACFFNPELL